MVALNVGLMEPMTWFARGLADQSITCMQLFRRFQHETPDSPISALFSVSPEKIVLSNEGSGVRSQLE